MPSDQVQTATDLYCEAFRQKLVPFLGSRRRAAACLATGLVSDRAIVALDQGAVVGLAGFKLARRGLFMPPFSWFLAEYRWSAPLRLLGLALLERREEADCLLMDGIAVSKPARGKGIGTRLLQAMEDHAIALGKTNIRLDVIDTNPRARQLYERAGFVAVRTSGLGPLRLLFPVERAIEMRKHL